MEGSLSQLAHLKPGGHALRREVVVRHQRERILAAVVEVVAENGYRKTSVAAIIKRAGVAKPKFYENFASKEDAFLQAFDAGLAAAAARLAAACEAAGAPAGGAGQAAAAAAGAEPPVAAAAAGAEPPAAAAAGAEPPAVAAAAAAALAARVDAGLGALLELLDERPALARAAFLEAPLLGAALGDRRAQVLAAFAPLLDGARAAAAERELPANLEETVLDGLYWLLYEAILAGQPERLTELRPALAEFALLPFLGPDGFGSGAARQA